MERRLFRLPVLVMVLTVVLGAGMLAGGSAQEAYPSLGLLTEVLRDIEKQYVTEVPPTQLVHDAVVGMLGDLDSESELIEPLPAPHDRGTEADVGLVTIRRKERLTIVAPIDGTPAQRAGLRAGDRILKIDGADTATMERSDAAAHLRGAVGTTVTVTIARQEWDEPRDLTLTRERLGGPTVSTRRLQDGVMYLRVHRFAESTGQELNVALSASFGGGLVLDLRNDAGGSVLDAVALVQRLLEPGQLIAYSEGRRSAGHREFSTSPSTAHLNEPIAVLVNQGSAAAAEIAAGALQDWARGVIVGTRTAGEASAQSIIPLPDGSAVRLTTARYFTPRGHLIEGTGILPDIEVAAAPDGDPQLDRAIQVLTIARTIRRHSANAAPGSI
jgi:carboxyl-terminal processing protease